MGHITSTQAGISADLRTVGTMADVLNSTGKDSDSGAVLQLSLFAQQTSQRANSPTPGIAGHDEKRHRLS